MSERVCLIHAGTHKTATTSLQLFLDANREALRSAGIYLPRSGRHESMPGHHIIAWDLFEDGKSAALDALLDELGSVDCRTAILTAEDFSMLHAKPQALRLLIEGLRSGGYRPITLMYLRAQYAFAESMYAERIKHRYVRAFGVFLNSILRTGSYHVENSITMMFRYSDLLAPFVRACGPDSVVVRPYNSRQDVAHVFKDFLAVLRAVDPDFRKANLSLDVQSPRANESLTFFGLLATAHAFFSGGDLANPELTAPQAAELVRSITPDFPVEALASRFALITRPEAVQLLQAFSTDNARVGQQFGVRIPFVTEEDLPPEPDPIWHRAQAERHVYDTLLERWMAERNGPAQ